MSVAVFLSRIMGLVREQAFAILFGAGNATDAFLMAFRIPNLLRDLFAEGAMSASLVPTFTRARIEEGDRRAWRIAGLVFRVLFVAVSILAILGILFAPELVSLYASAFKAVPGKFELTVRMTRIIFPFFPLVALAAAFMGILNACNVFFIPAFASALFNVVSILVGVATAQLLFQYGARWGIHPIEGMALGVVVGGAVQAISQIPSLRKVGYRFPKKEASDPSWKKDPALHRMLWMMVPGTVGLAATQINILVNSILATSQGTGAVSWLNYSFRLMQFPIGVFGVALASAVLPTISKFWVTQDVQGVQDSLVQSLKRVFAVNLPASAGLAFLGYPIIELIFQYGRFYPEDTQKTAFALAMYSIGLTAYSAVKVLVPACYALGKTRIAVISSVITVVATILMNLAMIGPFGYWGLALGTSIGALINALFLLYALRKLLRQAEGNLPLWAVFRSFLQHTAVALLMGGVCWASYRGLQWLVPETLLLEQLGGFGRASLPFARALKVCLLIAEGVLVVAVCARVFRISETEEILELFTRKLKKKLRPRQN